MTDVQIRKVRTRPKTKRFHWSRALITGMVIMSDRIGDHRATFANRTGRNIDRQCQSHPIGRTLVGHR